LLTVPAMVPDPAAAARTAAGESSANASPIKEEDSSRERRREYDFMGLSGGKNPRAVPTQKIPRAFASAKHPETKKARR
jgi:hypothetical protein